jgi:peptide/nickel transport system permease protein
VRWVVKFAALIGVVLAVTFLTYLMTDLLRGDPAEVMAANANRADDPAFVAQVRHELKLDRPLPIRYAAWLGGVLHGDLGRSYKTPREPVSDKLRRTVPNTLQLLLMAEILALVIAVPIGVWSAYRANGKFDKIATGTSFVMLAAPVFVVGILLIYVLAVQLKLLKVNFYPIADKGVVTSLQSSIMPVICLALGVAAVYARLLRSDMIATLQEDFILSARAKGLSNRYILFRHALRPSSFSLLTVAGINVGTLIGGSVIIETLFAVNGVGSLLVESISSRDILTVQAIVLLIAVVYVGVNFVVDLLYSTLDPRIRRA